MISFIIQALCVPIQGALNAVAYGWTRGDFLSVMSSQHFWNRPRGDSLAVSYDSVEGETMVEDEVEWERDERHQTRSSLPFSVSLRLAGRGDQKQKGGVMTPGSPGNMLGEKGD